VSKDGLEYTFQLRKGVKLHSPTKTSSQRRDFNADDVVVHVRAPVERKRPVLQASPAPTTAYFGDMGMPKLLKSVDKVDEYTVKITLNQARSTLPGQPGHAVRRHPVQGIRRSPC